MLDLQDEADDDDHDVLEESVCGAKRRSREYDCCVDEGILDSVKFAY